MKIDKLQEHYRPNIGIALFNRAGKVFLGRRVGHFDVRALKIDDQTDGWRWQMPQGGIDQGEDATHAAFRELREETGATSATLLTLTPGWVCYNFPTDYKRKNWKGQRQKWAAMLFTGDDGEIDLNADDHQEFDDWRWGDLEETPDLIVPFKRNVYCEVVLAFTPLRDFIRNKNN